MGWQYPREDPRRPNLKRPTIEEIKPKYVSGSEDGWFGARPREIIEYNSTLEEMEKEEKKKDSSDKSDIAAILIAAMLSASTLSNLGLETKLQADMQNIDSKLVVYINDKPRITKLYLV